MVYVYMYTNKIRIYENKKHMRKTNLFIHFDLERHIKKIIFYFSKVANFQIKMSEECPVCTKKVYPMEKVQIDGKLFHKNCFRCNHCKGQLK